VSSTFPLLAVVAVLGCSGGGGGDEKVHRTWRACIYATSQPPAQCIQDGITVELNPGGSASITIETVLEAGREGQALIMEAPGVPGIEQVFTTYNISLPGKVAFTLRVQPGSSRGAHHRLVYKINDSDDNVFDEVTILLNII
jgi:hypothetical protein